MSDACASKLPLRDTVEAVEEPEPPANGSRAFRAVFESPRYEQLRARLIRMFAQRGCPSPEDLADETIARVAEKIRTIGPHYEGEPEAYVFAVAKNVYREQLRQPSWLPFDGERDPRSAPAEEEEDGRAVFLARLDRCLAALDDDDRGLITEYYRFDKAAKIDHRRQLAARLGMGLNALRLRAYRIRRRLGECIKKCEKRTSR